MKKEIVKYGRILYQKGFLPATDGNISMRAGKNKIFITPSKVCKSFLKEKDILTVNFDGKVISGKAKPSIETKMHIYIYKKRPDINAVIHSHPPTATVLSTAVKKLENKNIITCALLGKIPVTPFALPGTSEVIKAIKPFVCRYNALLLAHHGVLAYAGNMQDAFFKTELTEYCAKTYAVSEIFGKTKNITPKQLKKILSLTGG
jgi:L-fuculose-phosphate aldolase